MLKVPITSFMQASMYQGQAAQMVNKIPSMGCSSYSGSQISVNSQQQHQNRQFQLRFAHNRMLMQQDARSCNSKSQFSNYDPSNSLEDESDSRGSDASSMKHGSIINSQSRSQSQEMSEIIQKQSQQAMISNYGQRFGFIGHIEELGEDLEVSG
jgi:hypothetical protein